MHFPSTVCVPSAQKTRLVWALVHRAKINLPRGQNHEIAQTPSGTLLGRLQNSFIALFFIASNLAGLPLHQIKEEMAEECHCLCLSQS